MNGFQLMITGKNTEKHEFLQFDQRPTNSEFVEALQAWCVGLARRAVLTRLGWAEDRVELKMTITADGEQYSSQEIADLYKGIYALSDAESFSIDTEIDGLEGDFTLCMIQTDSDGILDCISLDAGPELESLVSKVMDTEQFIYKCVEFLPDCGGFHYAMIENGAYVDLPSRMSADILKHENSEWWSWELFLGVDYPEDHPEIDEQIKDIVRMKLPEEELPYVQDRWNESEEENERFTSILNGSQWTGDLNSLEEFLCEVNMLVSPYVDACFGDADENILIDPHNFGVAKIVVDGQSAHVVGTYF